MKNRKIIFMAAAFLIIAAICFTAGNLVSKQRLNTDTYYDGLYVETNGAAMQAAPASAPSLMPAADYAEMFEMDFGGGIPEYSMTAESVKETAAAETASAASESVPPAVNSRKLIRRVGLSVETTDFSELLNDIQQSVLLSGGYIENSSVSGNSMFDDYNHHYAYLTARVPSSQLDHFITHISEKGNVTHRSENVEDVTLQYSDVESRKKTLSVEQEKLWELMEQAESMEAVIAIEQRLSEIRYQLETLESQLRTYDNQIDYSTVDIDITEVQVLTPTTPDNISSRIQKGFQRNLNAVGDTLTALFVWFISSIPSLSLLGFLILVIVLFVRRLLCSRKKRSAGEAKHESEENPDSPER